MEMEMEKAMKKLRNIVKAIAYVVKKGISNSKLFLDFSNLLIKRIAKLHSSHSDALFCHSQHYEFSCSNSPAVKRTANLYRCRAVLEMVHGKAPSESPVLPGYGAKEEEEEEEEAREVNMAADEFIRRFYRELRNQNYLALHSPYHP